MQTADPNHMRKPRRLVLALGLTILISVIAAAAWITTYRYVLSEEIARAEGRLSLFRTSVIAEIERFEHLTQVLAVDPFVQSALEVGPTDALNGRLQNFADAAGLDAIFLMDLEGHTIAASNSGTASSFVGENYGFRPYHQMARSGERGRFYGIGATTGLPGYFIADPVRNSGGAVAGVVAIKINLAPFEDSWRNAGEEVLLADGQDVVLLSSNPDWRYRTLAPLEEATRQLIDEARQFPGQALEPLDWQNNGLHVVFGDAERLHVETDNLPFGWHLHYFSSDAVVVTRAWMAVGAVLGLAGFFLILLQVQRTRRLRRALQRSEAEEAGLREANLRLASEIEDRRRAERRLKETRAELERASRLAALGQLSASVTHELGQPIAAMRNHLIAHEIGAGPTDNKLLQTITGLVDRMEGITRQLKFFARSDNEPLELVDLRTCVNAALDLLSPAISAAEVQLLYDAPKTAILAHGSRLRLEQVLTNLIRNALDAMVDAPQDRTLRIEIGTSGTMAWVDIADTGHGLGQATIEQLCEPFFSTRESGEGMGLGLAISAGILNDHGGHIQARNATDQSGSVFRMALPLARLVEQAAE